MSKLFIDSVDYGDIISFKITNGSNMKEVFLTILTNTNSVRYRLCEDKRATINDIKNDFNSGLNYAINNYNQNVNVREFTVRVYVYVKFPNNNTEYQYTGERI